MSEPLEPSIAGQRHDAAIFTLPQLDGGDAVLDMTRGPMGDLLIGVEVGGRSGRLAAYHSSEAAFFVAACRQWATHRRDEIGAELAAVRAWLAASAVNREPTERSQHDLLDDYGWREALASGFDAPVDVELRDEHRVPLVIEVSDDGLSLTRPPGDDVAGAVEVFVSNEYLHVLVAGLVWRTFGADGENYSSITRHNTEAYLAALDQFEDAVAPTR